MITLKNLKRIDNIITADVYPESYDRPGHIAVDVVKEEIVEFRDAPGNPYLSGESHAARAIIKLKNLETLPEKHVVIWY